MMNMFKNLSSVFVDAFLIQFNESFFDFINIEEISIVSIEMILFNIKLILKNIKKF